MKSIASCPWIILLSLVSTAVGVPPAYSNSSIVSESVGSHSSRSQERSRQAKPKRARPGYPTPNQEAPGFSKQPSGPRDPTQGTDEPLPQGQPDQPIAQGQISDRLEQFYKHSPEPTR